MYSHLTAPTVHSMETRDDQGFNDEDEAKIEEHRSRMKQGKSITTYRPKPLGWFSVSCVIANRMIGSGIFRTPDTVIKETESVAAAMLVWAVGALVTFAGVFVFVEFGLWTPRILVNAEMKSVPANGGEKNYVRLSYAQILWMPSAPIQLEYVYRPRRLVTCLFGMVFICLGNMASNAILFGQSFYIAVTGKDPSNGVVRGIAIATATLACFLHIYSRKLGIYLNNGFGSIKVLMLLALIIVAIVSFAGRFPQHTISDAKDNYVNHVGFGEPPSGSYGYASSFLAIIFAYGGFNQANYLLGNIRQPAKRFKLEAFSTVGIISVIYICLNLCYYGIVPYEQLIDPKLSTAVSFVGRTLTSSQARRATAAFQSFSSFGNIIIQTFTAARVKQEIAKEGILPWSRFFAANRTFTWKFWQHRAEREVNGEATPVGALLLHWVFSVAMILATFSLSPLDAYRLSVNLYSFTIDALFGFVVGAGLLSLRVRDFFRTKDKWEEISDENKWVSIAASALFTIANLYPLIAVWFRPPAGQPRAGGATIAFWITGTVGFATLACGLFYWVGLQFIYPAIVEKDLVVERRPFTVTEYGEEVVANEVVTINWESR